MRIFVRYNTRHKERLFATNVLSIKNRSEYGWRRIRKERDIDEAFIMARDRPVTGQQDKEYD